MAPPASIRLGAQTALVRCQVAQGPHPRVRFFARGGGGGVGLVLRSASARLDVRQASACDLQRFLAFSDYEGRLPQDATALHANFCPPKRTACHYDMSCRRVLHD